MRGLPLPVARFEVYDARGVFVARPDLSLPGLRIAIEVDTVTWHSGRRRIEYDSHRQNRLVELGWTVLRYSRRMIDETPTQVIASVAATIARAEAMTLVRA